MLFLLKLICTCLVHATTGQVFSAPLFLQNYSAKYRKVKRVFLDEKIVVFLFHRRQELKKTHRLVGLLSFISVKGI